MKHNVEIYKTWFQSDILFVDIPDDELLNFKIYINSWDSFCPSFKYEVAHLLEHCLFEKNKRFATPLEFKVAMEKLWIYKNWFSWFYYNYYIVNWAITKYKEILPFLLDLVCKVELKEDIFNNQKNVVFNEMTWSKNDHRRLLAEKMNKFILPWYATSEERCEMIKHINFDDICAHYTNFYTPSNFTFFISWNIQDKKKEIIEMIESYFKETAKWWKKPIDYSYKDDYKNKLAYVDIQEKTNYEFRLEFIVDTNEEKDRDDYMFFMNILLNWMWSRLQNKAREKWLAYTIQNIWWVDRNFITVGFYERVPEENLIPLLQLIVDEMKDVLAWNVSDDEIERTIWYMQWNLLRRYTDWESILNFYLHNYLFEENVSLQEYMDSVKYFNKDNLISFWKKFDMTKWYFWIIGKDAEKKTSEVSEFLKEYIR